MARHYLSLGDNLIPGFIEQNQLETLIDQARNSE